jgi:hypothetical protein
MQRSYIKVECNKQNMVETQEPTKLQFIKNTLQKLSKWYHAEFKPKARVSKSNRLHEDMQYLQFGGMLSLKMVLIFTPLIH